MNGIELKSGVNNCSWNIEGKCTHKTTYRGEDKMSSIWSRNWESKENCVVTQLGTRKCSNYKSETSETF